ncbi:unnamed protein product [Rotaria sordida]|uniref:Uncharacterized protein n=1 Tax=Rotaria sordida TaxID=392033 RepID=A0A816D433_9BILA|nr:unnamed protein product [Rotaria sordida]CAF1630071.1 unnamed protein product [Rotaria sordida]
MVEASVEIFLTDASNDDNPITVEKNENDASKFIGSGRSHARNGKYSQAITDLAHATHLQPTNYEAFYYLGLAYLKDKQLEEMFMACKTIASGRVRPMEGKLGTFADVITLAGELISLVPVVGEPISKFAQPISMIAKAIDYRQQRNTMTHIANLGTTQELWKISQSVAQQLTENYRPLLLELLSSNKEDDDDDETEKQVSEAKCCGCIPKSSCFKSKSSEENHEHPLTRQGYIQQVRDVAEYAVALMLEFLLNHEKVDHVKKQMDRKLISDAKKTTNEKSIDGELQPLVEKLVNAVRTPLEDQFGIDFIKNGFEYYPDYCRPQTAPTAEWHRLGRQNSNARSTIFNRSPYLDSRSSSPKNVIKTR